MSKGKVIWITGLSGSGKSTLAAEVVSRLRQRKKPVILLDGDELRDVFGATAESVSNHAREGRLELAMQYSRLCNVIASQGLTVVIGTISLFCEVHKWNRQNLSGYFEVFLKVPMDELRRRDPKGIYRRYEAGKLTNVAGLDMQIDEPETPDWVIDSAMDLSVSDAAEQLLEKLEY